MCFLQIKSDSSNLRINYSIEGKTFEICNRCLVSLFQFSSFLLFSFLFLLFCIIINCTQCIALTIFYCWCVSNLSDGCGHACLIIMFLLSYMISTKRSRNPVSLTQDRNSSCLFQDGHDTICNVTRTYQIYKQSDYWTVLHLFIFSKQKQIKHQIISIITFIQKVLIWYLYRLAFYYF